MAVERKLTKDERILWGKVARTARPLKDMADDPEVFEEELERQPELKGSVPDTKNVLAESTSSNALPKTPGRHHPLERPVKRKIAKGRLPLEARLDLHGLVQHEAHGMLLDFLIRAHRRGLRHVLVITGKGSSMGSEGALKRAVPLWFSNPEFRLLISSYEPAAHHHGGEGALYIRLSRTRGTGV